jgi:hypothetical protein
MNQYLNKGMITEPEEFYGRKEEIENIYERIKTTQSTFIVGERGIGKSSLLYYLYREKDKYLDNPERYIYLFIGIQGENINTPQDFFRVLLRELREKAKDKIYINEDISYENVKNAVPELDKAGYKLILFIDEFDLVADNNEFDGTFYANLRALAPYNVAYIITSIKKIKEHGNIITSPFFNIFIEIHLLPFSKNEAMELIKNLSTRQGVSLKDESEFILDVAGLHPFFIQIVCSVLFKYKSKGKKLSKSDLDKTREEIWDESKSHFEYIWNHLSNEERDVLSKLARSKQINETSEHKLYDLEMKGYVIKKEQKSFFKISSKYNIFSSVFKKFVIEKRL